MIPHLRNSYINSTAELLAAAFLVIILISSMVRKKTAITKRPFCIMTVTLILLLTESAVAWSLDGYAILNGSAPRLDMIRHVLIGLDYMLYGTMDDFFFLYLIASVREKRAVSAKRLRQAHLLFGVFLFISLAAGAAFMSSLWSGIFFRMDAYGGIDVTPGYLFLTAASMLSDAASLFLVIRERRTLGWAKTLSCLVYLFVPAALVGIDVTYRLTTSYVSCAMVMFLIYIAIDVKQDRDLLQREAEVARGETERTDMKVNLMMSQIQPHFLYNTLSTIAYLCRTDPNEAEMAVNEFADYLRMNLRSINTNHPILFETELKHVENYLKIQKRRFPEQMNVVYDIRAEGFRIPALTLQPIVENAVKYGVETRFETTTIRIASEETDESYIVTVSDDGPGFDPTARPKEDRLHIGIMGVTNRLNYQVNGTLKIDSAPGAGTTATVTIPKYREAETA